MALLGTLTFRALDSSDVFLKADVWEDGKELMGTEIVDDGFNGTHPWETGKGRGAIPVDVEGDSTIIFASFTGASFTQPFEITICLEYEEEEVFLKKERDEEQ